MSHIIRAPSLILPKRVPIDRVLERELSPMRMEGRFKVELIRKVGAKEIILRELPWQKNLITNVGLDLVATSTAITNITSSPLAYVAVGTGSTAPANTDTTLVSETGVRTNDNGSIADVTAWGAGNAYVSFTRTRLFTEAQSNGNLTEFGFFTASTSGSLFCRQLFKDGGGTPTTIVKTSSDQLRITYELRVYPPTVDTSGTISISAVNYDWTGRAQGVGGSGWGNVLAAIGDFDSNAINTSVAFSRAYETQTLSSITGAGPSGAATGPSTRSVATYVNGNYYIDNTEKWEPGVANYATGIGATVYGSFFQTSWNPKFSKDNTKRLTLVTRISWARH